MTVRHRARGALGIVAATALFVLSGSPDRHAVVHGQAAPAQANRPEISRARHDTSGRLSQMPQLPPRAVGAVLRRKVLPYRIGSDGAPGDDALQIEAPGPGVLSGLQNFEGTGNVNAVLPPDTTGDIGPNHYVQMVNLSFAV